jgi:hypothetical protein
MAYTQKAGRGNSAKTGNGIPSPLLQKKPSFKGSTDKGEMGGGYLGESNTDLLKVAKHYGGKAVGAVKEVASKVGKKLASAGEYAADFAEGKHGSSSYSGGDESMRQKNIGRKKSK